MDEDQRPSARLTIGWFVLAALGIGLLGFLGGVTFGRAAPERAASSLLRGVATATGAPTESPELAHRPDCGLHRAPLDDAARLAAWATGVVVVEHTTTAADLAVLERWLQDDPGPVVVAPSDALETPIVATSWAWRMPLQAADLALLDAFVTAHGGTGPAAEGPEGGCPG